MGNSGDVDRLRWYDTASVRIASPGTLPSDAFLHSLAFSPNLVPVASHPIVVKKGCTQEVLVHHLYNYLQFTISLEHDAINSVLHKIATGRSCIQASRQDRLAAHRIVCDEAFHALFSAEFASELLDHMSISPTVYRLNGAPHYQSVLEKIKAEVSLEEADLVDFLFAVTSETLITGTLVRGPRDARVAHCVREMLRHHATDEAFHHIYFANLFGKTWSCLSVQMQGQLAKLLPSFLFAFLSPDFELLARMLHEFGFSDAETTKILRESYPVERQVSSAIESSKGTVALARKNGVEIDFSGFEKRIRESFHEHT